MIDLVANIIELLAIFSLAYLIKEVDGPYGIIGKARHWLMSQPSIGVFFYGLFSCYYCLGFHCGWFVYLLTAETYKWQFFILWGLAGAITCLILGQLLTKLSDNSST